MGEGEGEGEVAGAGEGEGEGVHACSGKSEPAVRGRAAGPALQCLTLTLQCLTLTLQCLTLTLQCSACRERKSSGSASSAKTARPSDCCST